MPLRAFAASGILYKYGWSYTRRAATVGGCRDSEFYAKGTSQLGLGSYENESGLDKHIKTQKIQHSKKHYERQLSFF
ncbi:hypothetical protein AwPolaro_02310 [Polaromonas sp.]|nr:hypothetical protein AwPolaro_02310 [Polaromonas sp.]